MMRKGVIIAAAILLALLAAAGIVLVSKNNDSPPVRIIEDNMDNTSTNDIINANDEIIKTQDAQIADLRAQIDELERKMAQQEFDYTALKAEKDRLEKRNADLADQNSWLRGRNNDLSSSENKLKDDILALNAELARISKEREADEAAYQEALARIEEYEAKVASAQAALDEANSVPGTRVTEDGRILSTFNTLPLGQSRNIIGIKGGESDIDLEAAFALMPHWFLVTEIGIIDAPDDFVRTEFPGLTADHAFMFTALFGTGLNWRVNSIPGQPNFYIETMLGPAVYRYIIKNTDEKGINTYLLWRSAIGFDLTLYKNLQFTTEVGLDYIINCELTPRVTIGLQYSFSNNWALFGGR